MTILIIEDNDIKYDLIRSCIAEIDSDIGVERAASYQSGVEALVTKGFAFVVLDMTLPVFDMEETLVGADVLTFGGSLILRECKRKRVTAKFAILSQYDTFVRGDKEITFDELQDELLKQYAGIVVGCVRLDRTSVKWKADLASLIQSL